MPPKVEDPREVLRKSMKKALGNFPEFRTEYVRIFKEDEGEHDLKVSSLGNDQVCYIGRSGRLRSRLGRYMVRQLGLKANANLDRFCALTMQLVKDRGAPSMKIQYLTTPEEIGNAYRRGHGGSSCMTGISYVQELAECCPSMNMLLVGRSARALVWEVGNKFYVDRVYINEDHSYDATMQATRAITKWTAANKNRIPREAWTELKVTVPLTGVPEHWPYLDTMYKVSKDKLTLGTYPVTAPYKAHSTEGCLAGSPCFTEDCERRSEGHLSIGGQEYCNVCINNLICCDACRRFGTEEQVSVEGISGVDVKSHLCKECRKNTSSLTISTGEKVARRYVVTTTQGNRYHIRQQGVFFGNCSLHGYSDYETPYNSIEESKEAKIQWLLERTTCDRFRIVATLRRLIDINRYAVPKCCENTVKNAKINIRDLGFTPSRNFFKSLEKKNG